VLDGVDVSEVSIVERRTARLTLPLHPFDSAIDGVQRSSSLLVHDAIVR
jgi:hypothetical protein